MQKKSSLHNRELARPCCSRLSNNAFRNELLDAIEKENNEMLAKASQV